MKRPQPLLAGFADAFLRGYVSGAPDDARPYCEVDANIVRVLLGVPDYTIRPDEPLVSEEGTVVYGIGTSHDGGLSIVYWTAEMDTHSVVINCQPWRAKVTVPTAEDPEF